jgi:hypothetical protein
VSFLPSYCLCKHLPTTLGERVQFHPRKPLDVLRANQMRDLGARSFGNASAVFASSLQFFQYLNFAFSQPNGQSPNLTVAIRSSYRTKRMGSSLRPQLAASHANSLNSMRAKLSNPSRVLIRPIEQLLPPQSEVTVITPSSTT